ncbi:helix-turn-helix domain-containing protein [Christiangramia crocea]|uniref:Helix-turn-helix domain-containing protein n=1 Tax=Christiangramia crocea TaxID=2904124 RepID=A0A9X1UW37_9FLAO|nr:helix-turn-helix domain-containing protein [Gramella crocea]MCG9971170.1 helix-turn-helix domain-containing protein [Gramella crocea]
MEKDKMDFTGIWVPVEVLELKCVSGNELLLLSYIIGLSNNNRGCYATNKHLAERLGLSRGRISEMISSLFNKGLITYKIYKSEGNKRSIFPNLETLSEKSVNPIKINGYTYMGKNVNPLTEKAKHNNKVYNKEEIKEERGISHIEYLNTYCSKDIQNWKKENEHKLFNKLEFYEAFNNDMILESTKMNEKLFFRFKKYARNWIIRQKPSDRPEPRPPWLRKFE